jgi:hypothetical protein
VTQARHLNLWAVAAAFVRAARSSTFKFALAFTGRVARYQVLAARKRPAGRPTVPKAPGGDITA